MATHNIHIHSSYSDGKLSPEKIVEVAKQKYIPIIGFSDHAFSSKLSDLYQITHRIDGYLNDLRQIRQFSGDIKILIGIEIDVSTFYGTSPSRLPFDALNGFDYVLFEYVNTEEESWGRVGGRDISDIAKIRHKLEIPVGLAHNDMQKNYYGREKQIASTLADNDIFIELCQSEFGRNTRNGLDYYRHFSDELVDELLRREVKVAVGTDCHKGEGLNHFNDAFEFITEKNLQLHQMLS